MLVAHNHNFTLLWRTELPRFCGLTTKASAPLCQKIIDTLNDQPNVLWIEEAPPHSKWWNNHLIAFARSYEASRPIQHPIGYGVLGDFYDTALLHSDADWIAPAGRVPQSRLWRADVFDLNAGYRRAGKLRTRLRPGLIFLGFSGDSQAERAWIRRFKCLYLSASAG
jgi:hypothetical protein